MFISLFQSCAKHRSARPIKKNKHENEINYNICTEYKQGKGLLEVSD